MVVSHPSQELDASEDQALECLPPGTELFRGRYTIGPMIEQGQFEFIYDAHDADGMRVRIKECYAKSFCKRDGLMITARSRGCASHIRAATRRFLKEAKSLANLDHANILHVHDVFRENQTAYIVLEYVDAATLHQIIKDGALPLRPDVIKNVVRKGVEALGHIHERNMLHRDISPRSIAVDRNGDPVIIDFRAAREKSTTSRSVQSSALRVINDDYAPHEFYHTGSAKTPSGDLYSFAATMYHVLTGQPPAKSQNRLVAAASGEPDPYVPLMGLDLTGHDPAMLRVIDMAMNVLPQSRPPTAADWLAKISK